MLHYGGCDGGCFDFLTDGDDVASEMKLVDDAPEAPSIRALFENSPLRDKKKHGDSLH